MTAPSSKHTAIATQLRLSVHADAGASNRNACYWMERVKEKLFGVREGNTVNRCWSVVDKSMPFYIYHRFRKRTIRINCDYTVSGYDFE